MAAPPAGSFFAAPPVPPDFAADPTTVGSGVPATTLATCYAVTTGPDRNIYWVYSHMAQTATAIPLPNVNPPTCFETKESIAVSQGKTRPLQKCVTCNSRINQHTTAAQAQAAFAAHAIAHPLTHANINAPVGPGVTAPSGYATLNGIIAPIVAAVAVPLPGVAPAPVPPAPAPVPVAPVALVGLNAPSTPAPAAQYKLLTDMVKINPQLVWSDQQDASRFLDALESILEFSPVVQTHWITLIPMMIPGQYELERTWVRNNIMTPLLSWNAAKAAFVSHFQRGDHVDNLRWLYNDCRQTSKDTIQTYSRRFQSLAHDLGYADGDTQSIYKYISGLNFDVQQKMNTHKVTMRTIGAVPGWEFTSLTATAALALELGTPAVFTPQPQSATPPPLHLRHSALANPIYQSTTTSSSSSSDSSRPQTRFQRKRNATEVQGTGSEEYKCMYHPRSRTHTTEECRTKGNKIQRANTPPKSKPPTGTPVSNVSLPPSRQQQSSQRQSAPAQASLPTDLSQVECYRCHQKGHYSSMCPQRDGVPSQGNRGRGRGRGGRARRARVSFVPSDQDDAKAMVISTDSSRPIRSAPRASATSTESQ